MQAGSSKLMVNPACRLS